MLSIVFLDIVNSNVRLLAVGPDRLSYFTFDLMYSKFISYSKVTNGKSGN